MFSSKTANSDDWKAVISAISTLVEEATFEATKEGLAFQGIDPSRVALIFIKWPASDFEAYSCDKDIKIGFRVDEFSKLIKRAQSSDSIQIDLENEGVMTVKIGKNRSAKMRLVNIEANYQKVPALAYTAKIELKENEFDRVLGDIGTMSNFLAIKSSGITSVFSGKGDAGEISVNYDSSEPNGKANVLTTQDSEGIYSLEYITSLVKAVGSTESTTIEYGNKMPLRIGYKIGKTGTMDYYLAPRMN